MDDLKQTGHIITTSKYRFKDLLAREQSYDDRVKVEFFTNENTFKERLQIYFLQNQRSSLQIRIFNLFIKLLSCVLYVVRVLLDQDQVNSTRDCVSVVYSAQNSTFLNVTLEDRNSNSEPCQPDVPTFEGINWIKIFWVDRAAWLWGIQVVVAIISLTETLLVIYITYKGNIWMQILAPSFILEAINTVPFIITIFEKRIREMFVPVFLNCWLAKIALNDMLSDLHRVMQKSQSTLSQQLIFLIATISCLVFTSVCGIQHLQRGGKKALTLFDSLWYVTVTFSTVGYGDVAPDIWPSKLFMMVLICSAFVVLPTKFEQLAFTWMEKQKMGGNYSSHRAQSEKHVVVVATMMQADTIMDFLNEFYAHPKVQNYYVVLLSPCELDPTMKLILQVPIWAARVIYIKGSALKDTDLSRCRMQDAEACFMIAARNYSDKAAADQHTVLRAWAVKDFAPHCPQYVQIFRPESKIHVHFAEHVVCEDEFKYALLANNCLFPGMSTFVTLLLHTSRGAEGQTSNEEWMKLYGKCSGNEIYHIRLSESRFFGEYKDKSFTFASFHAHRKYGVSLIGVQTAIPGSSLLLNPGPLHIMSGTDLCFYMSIAKEENSAFVLSQPENAGLVGNFGASFKRRSMKVLGREAKRDSVFKRPSLTDTPLHCKKQPSNGGGTSSPLKQRTPLLLSNEPSDETKYSSTKVNKPSVLFKPIQDETENQFHKTLASPPINSQTTSPSNVMVTYHKSYSKPANLASEENSTSELDADYDYDEDETDDVKSDDGLNDAERDGVAMHGNPDDSYDLYCGFPPITPYICASPTYCHLVRTPRSLCCLNLSLPCSHCPHKQAQEYEWTNRSIIVAADRSSNALYNFIVPLRSHSRHQDTLRPIVLLLEEQPSQTFLETISNFPLVYWMIGSIERLDDLFLAGIQMADSVVVANKESSNAGQEDTLADCNTIVAVQSMFRYYFSDESLREPEKQDLVNKKDYNSRLFPSANIVTELSQASNMRFMQFRARDIYALQLSKLEKKEKERGSQLYYMFRLPFAAGNVFTSSMLDTLLYQAFVKDYVIKFVRLLLGIDQETGSGHLSSIQLTTEDLSIGTYGLLYQKLCSTTHQIPIGIYRTQSQKDWSQSNSVSSNLKCGDVNYGFEEKEIEQMVKCRLVSLGLPPKQPNTMSYNRESISYVIVNPGYDLELDKDDVIYVINPFLLSPHVTTALDETK